MRALPSVGGRWKEDPHNIGVPEHLFLQGFVKETSALPVDDGAEVLLGDDASALLALRFPFCTAILYWRPSFLGQVLHVLASARVPHQVTQAGIASDVEGVEEPFLTHPELLSELVDGLVAEEDVTAEVLVELLQNITIRTNDKQLSHTQTLSWASCLS